MVDPVALAGGVFLVLAGLPAVLAPRTTATVGEMFDAIGSTRSRHEVQPTGWNVTWTRFGGVLLTFLGVVFVALAFQSPGP